MKNIKLKTALIVIVVSHLTGVAQVHGAKRNISGFLKVRSGETLIRILRLHGFNSGHISQLLSQNNFPKKFNLFPNNIYKIDKTKNKTTLKFYPQFEDKTLKIWKDNKKSGFDFKKADYKVKVKSVTGKIQGPLVSSIKKHTGSEGVALRFMDAYLLQHNLVKEVKRNAKFKISFEQKYDGDRLIKAGEVLATSLELNNKVLKRKFVKKSEKEGYFKNVTGKDLSHRQLYLPVNYMRITSAFKPSRKHPITKRRIAHLGVDFELPKGTDTLAAQSGKVLRFGRTRAAGNYVVIKHSNGLTSFYNHLDSIDKKIKKGAWIKAGERVGAIGCTGYCTKPHLHYAVKKNGRFVNPLKYLKNYSKSQKI
ncbi:peptidoglycan DD-metalloendopeptidase family protein [bacterium]|nr:peptidoglycan DD-metalloendopeptidase family protein [bacterium]